MWKDSPFVRGNPHQYKGNNKRVFPNGSSKGMPRDKPDIPQAVDCSFHPPQQQQQQRRHEREHPDGFLTDREYSRVE